MIITDISILRKKNEEASLEEAAEIIKKLEDELSKTTGIGLSANQIGIHKKVAVVRIRYENGREEKLDLVNPVVLEQSGSFINNDEGCLSIPDKKVNTYRFREIFVKDDLHPAGFVATGLSAIAVSHEVDHLDGLLIIDRIAGKNRVGRNDPCPCGRRINGKPVKWKKCHGKK